VYLFLALLERVEQPERAIQRLRDFKLTEPLVVRARSAAAALSAEVPLFGGLRSLATGADDDRLILISPMPRLDAAEAERLVSRIQLEMDADEPPMGTIIAVPMFSAVQPKPGT
jgi:hypothetical protein